MSEAMSKEDYLKKYLSDPKKGKKKKKSKGKGATGRTKIVDDDVDLENIQATKEAGLFDDEDPEDRPQIAGIVDDRPAIVQKLELFKNTAKWRALNEDNIKQEPDDDYPLLPKSGRHDSDESPLRTKRYDSDESPERRRRHDSDSSPVRRKRHDSDPSPPRGKKHDSDALPPRRQRHDSDASPPRRRRHDSDTSPPRRKQRESDASPPRRQRHDSDGSPPRRRRHDSDASSPRRKRRESDASPPRRRRHDSDASPPQRQRHGSDTSPPRRRRHDSDASPPRKKRQVSSHSPLRKRRRDMSPSGNRQKHMRRDSGDSPPRSSKDRHARSSRGHDFRNSEDAEKRDSRSRNMEKTMDGKKAGLQDAKSLVLETREIKRREAEMFSKLDDELSGRRAATIVRDKTTGKRINLEEERQKKKEVEEKNAKLAEKYAKWNRGLKQLENQASNLEETMKEMSKPLARYADDKDLDKHLREQERIEDPMLEYINRKKAQKAGAKPGKPMYKGPLPLPNRFGILPGYRWDGVDRSNGYEKQWFLQQNNRKAAEEDAYKWSVEDM